MALSSEILANVPELTAEQITAITTLSANDEAAALAAQQTTISTQYAADLATAAGVQPTAGEAFSAFAARAAAGLRGADTEQLSTKLAAQTARVSELEETIKSGAGDSKIAQALADAESKLTALQTMYDTEKAGFETQRTEFQNTLLNTRVAGEIDKSLTGLKFREGLPDSVKSILIDSARNTVLSKHRADFEGDRLIFRKEGGDILRNAKNKLEPYTAAELIREQLADALQEGAASGGGGTGGTKAATSINLDGARTQVQADEAIAAALATEGFVRGSIEYTTEKKARREAAGVASLPVQ